MDLMGPDYLTLFTFTLVLNVGPDSFVLDHGLSREDCLQAIPVVYQASGLLADCEIETEGLMRRGDVPGYGAAFRNNNGGLVLSFDKYGKPAKAKKKKAPQADP